MKRVPSSQAPLGVFLARDVRRRTRANTEMTLLNAGTPITESLRDALTRAGIDEVWVDDTPEGVDPSQGVSSQTYARLVEDIDALRARSARDGARITRTDTASLERTLAQLIAEVRDTPSVTAFVPDTPARGCSAAEHAALMTMLATHLTGAYYQLMPPRFGSREDSLADAALGFALCDLSTATMPAEVEALTRSRLPRVPSWVRQHPQMSLRLLAEDAFPALTRRIIADHHERVDGRGYPGRREPSQIHPLAQIAQIAHQFTLLAHARVHSARMSRAEAWEAVLTLAADGAVSMPMVHLFRRSVAPFPLGAHVSLSDGSQGVVSAFGDMFPERPTLRLTRSTSGAPAQGECDLAERLDLTVAGVARR